MKRPSYLHLHLLLLLLFSLLLVVVDAKASGNALSVRLLRQEEEEVEDQNLYYDNIPDALVPTMPFGHDSCPCLTKDQISLALTEDIIDIRDDASFGVYCQPHDMGTPRCSDLKECITKIPIPTDCDRSYCRRSWCYVDEKNCQLEHVQSNNLLGNGISYSYATCGFLDSYTSVDNYNTLQNQTYKVGFLSNTGGWRGSYNIEGHFAPNSRQSQWTGPTVDFFIDVAQRGGFTMVSTKPPDFLLNASEAFFGNSKFSLCVYAVSLGYLDFCVAAMGVNNRRSSVTPFFELYSDPVYLVTFTGADQLTNWERYQQQVALIFEPFTPQSWAMIITCVVILSLIMLFHEYGAPGSAFPKERDFQVIHPRTRGLNNKGEETYDVGVVTWGGKIHLVGVFAFLVLVLAVYTANLAAFLTTSTHAQDVQSLEEAIQAGYKFCASRNTVRKYSKLYNIDTSRFVVDPPSEGGDGRPGFSCGNCGARSRVFDFMKQANSNDDHSLYCEAAIAQEEDLQVFHQYGLHCNKTVVGDILGFSTMGVPITKKLSDSLISWLYNMKYEGLYQAKLQESLPASRCSDPQDEQNEDISLSVEQLAGIWVIVFMFVLGGLIGKVFHYYYQHKREDIQKVWVYDQWGRACKNSNLNQTDERAFITTSLFGHPTRDSIQHKLSVRTSDFGVPSVPRDTFTEYDANQASSTLSCLSEQPEKESSACKQATEDASTFQWKFSI